MAVRVSIDEDKLRRALNTDEVRAALRRRAEAGKEYAQRIAPVDTGLYRASMTVVTGTRGGLPYARLLNPVPYAGFLEYGTRYMRPFRTLGQAMDAMSF